MNGSIERANQHRDDKKVLPLQAADMLAWHIRRDLERGEEELAASPYVRVDGQHFVTRFDRYRVQDMADKMSKVPGIETVRDKKAWQKMKLDVHYRLDHGLGPPQVTTKFQRLTYRTRAGLFGFLVRVLDGLQNALKWFQ